MLDFFSAYWPLILILFVLVIIVFAIRGVRRALKEGGGAFKVENAKKASDANLLWLKQAYKAIALDADLICKTKGDYIVPTKQDIRLLKKVVAKKMKIAMYLLPEAQNFAHSGEVVYFFCKSERALERRLKNLLPNREVKSKRWPYADPDTGYKLKYKPELDADPKKAKRKAE